MNSPSQARPAASSFRWTICALLFFSTTVNYMDRQVISYLKPFFCSSPDAGGFGWTNSDFANLTSAQIAILTKIPILVVVGDHFSSAQPSPACTTELQQINAAGGDMTFIALPKLGLNGNSHMFMQDKNNLEVADIIQNWISRHVESKQRGG